MKQRPFLSRFFARPQVRAYLLLLSALALCCVLAPVLAPCDPNQINPVSKFAPLSAAHPLGTDHLGRDILSRLLWGGRNTLGYALAVTVFSAGIGVCLGMLAGCCAGGWADSLLMKGSDVLRAFPGVVFVLIIVSALGVSIANVCLAMLLTRWIWYARVTRNLTQVQYGRSSVLASRLAGSSWFQILRRHIFPAILPELLAVFSVDFGSALLAVSGYSFLGLGVLPPKAEWGMMINDGRNHMAHPGMMVWPGLCILVTVVLVNLLGDKLRDFLEEERT